MGGLQRNGRVLFMLGVVLIVAGLILALAAAGGVGTIVALAGFALLLLGWVGEQRREAVMPPKPPR